MGCRPSTPNVEEANLAAAAAEVRTFVELMALHNNNGHANNNNNDHEDDDDDDDDHLVSQRPYHHNHHHHQRRRSSFSLRSRSSASTTSSTTHLERWEDIATLQQSLAAMEAFFETLVSQQQIFNEAMDPNNTTSSTMIGPPPASSQAIASLCWNAPLSKTDLSLCTKCSICCEVYHHQDNNNNTNNTTNNTNTNNDSAVRMMVLHLPCGHFFHSHCVMPWLTRHCTCPTCRFELPTDDDDFEEGRLVRMQTRKLPPSLATIIQQEEQQQEEEEENVDNDHDDDHDDTCSEQTHHVNNTTAVNHHTETWDESASSSPSSSSSSWGEEEGVHLMQDWGQDDYDIYEQQQQDVFYSTSGDGFETFDEAIIATTTTTTVSSASPWDSRGYMVQMRNEQDADRPTRATVIQRNHSSSTDSAEQGSTDISSFDTVDLE